MNESTEQQLRREIEELRRQLHAQHEPHGGVPAERWKPSGLTVSALMLGIVILLAGAFFAGYIPLERRDSTVQAEAEEHEKALPRVEVLHVGRAKGESGLELPGTMEAITEASILARADGYLKTRLVDIGDRVKSGQPLAEIDAPELNQQIHQAEAAVEQAEAALEQAQASLEQGKTTLNLAKVTAGRFHTLAQEGVASKQDDDQYQAQFAAQTANVQALEKAVSAQRSNVAANKANLGRLEELQSYLIVKAPFDGVITTRNVDIGVLVTAGSTLLYKIAQSGTLRTFVNVPQVSSNSVRVGQGAALTLSNFPGRRFHGTVVRTAHAIDPTSRTMLVEVDVPNGDGALFPGMYADVDLSSPRVDPPLTVPAQAILFRTDGAQLASVTPDGTVHLRKITVGHDYGDRVEILQGIEEGATVIASPGDAAQEGNKILPVEAESAGAK